MPASDGLLIFTAPTLSPDDFAGMRDLGLDVSPPTFTERGFTLSVTHPRWGSARLTVGDPRGDLTALIATLETTDASLTDTDRVTLRRARSAVAITHESATPVTMARKHFLSSAHAALGRRGLGVIDLLARRAWSREALDIEVRIDAEVDVTALFALHAIATDEGTPVWIHTHGLAQAGAFDIDILNPDEALLDARLDTLRSLAFAVLEGRAQANGEAFELAWPEGDIALVPVEQFMQGATPEVAALRENDDDHCEARAVVCESPASPFAEISGHLVPSLFTSSPEPEGTMHLFSAATSELMSRRARASFPMLEEHIKDLRARGHDTLVKLAYEDVNGGREHLWFRVHSTREGHVDATLINAPHAIPSLSQGQRGWHPVDRLTEWVARTPFGAARPWFPKPLRRMRAESR